MSPSSMQQQVESQLLASYESLGLLNRSLRMRG